MNKRIKKKRVLMEYKKIGHYMTNKIFEYTEGMDSRTIYEHFDFIMDTLSVMDPLFDKYHKRYIHLLLLYRNYNPNYNKHLLNIIKKSRKRMKVKWERRRKFICI